MGMSLSTYMGVGFEVPTDEESLLITNDLVPSEVDEGYYDFDWYEFTSNFIKDYSTLKFEIGNSVDYFIGAAVLVRRLTKYGYYGNVSFDLSESLSLTDQEEQELKAAAEALGVDYSPALITVVSYG